MNDFADANQKNISITVMVDRYEHEIYSLLNADRNLTVKSTAFSSKTHSRVALMRKHR